MPYWRLSGVYFTYFTVVGAVSPFWALYLASLGLSASEIGLLAAIPLITKLISPNVWGYLADRTGRELSIIRLGAFGGASCFAFLLFREDYLSLAIFISLYSFFWNAILPQFETLTLRFLSEEPYRYSKVRVWGSLGFIASVLGLGYLFDFYSISLLPLIILIFLSCIFLFSMTLPGLPRTVHPDKLSGFLSLVKQKTTLVFFLVLFLLQLSHGVYYVFYSIYMESWGFAKSTIGWLWALGVVSEIVIFMYMPRIFHRFSLYSLLTWSLFITALRWLGIALVPQYLLCMLILQVLHAFSFGVIHAVAIEYLRRSFGPAHQGQAQAFYSAFSFGGGAALGAYLSGLIWDLNSSLAFILASVVAALGWLGALLFLRNQSHLS
ncbi:putative 3-phenylpropionic acid transporter [Thalassocella blandensis]|nr:putative 3-phenylpropionic acid transporter [Thalassocella blandensis]